MPHSPGVWTIDHHARTVCATDERGTFPVCDIRGWGHLTGKGHGALGLHLDVAEAIQRANANLIAAAPDLLDACHAARIVLQNRDQDEREASLFTLLKTVIAKAEGR